jgi:DNA-binding HxlR family transcriptional regulator
LTISEVRHEGERERRAGAQVLALLAAPINATVLRALAEGKRPLKDLRREAGLPPQTTMRAHLQHLTRTGILIREQQKEFPGSVEFRLSQSGEELVEVAGLLSSWLGEFPEGPTTWGEAPAKGAIKALLQGWSTNMIRAMAARPLSLTELDSLIGSVSYPSLERRLAAMKLAGLVEPTATDGRGRPYTATVWLRKATAPLVAATRWERSHLNDQSGPISARDVEAVFLLGLPLVRLSSRRSGSCRLVVELGTRSRSSLSGVVAAVKDGRVERCTTRLQGDFDAWAVGSVGAWFSATVEGVGALETGGDSALVFDLMEALQRAVNFPGSR